MGKYRALQEASIHLEQLGYPTYFLCGHLVEVLNQAGFDVPVQFGNVRGKTFEFILTEQEGITHRLTDAVLDELEVL